MSDETRAPRYRKHAYCERLCGWALYQACARPECRLDASAMLKHAPVKLATFNISRDARRDGGGGEGGAIGSPPAALVAGERFAKNAQSLKGSKG
jgi:hypothetical protein